MKQQHLMFILIAVAVVGLIGCSRKPADFEGTFSPVYREFNAAVLAESASKNPGDIQDRGSWNTKTKRGSRQMRGLLRVGPEANPCAEILSRLDSFVTARTSSLHSEGELAKEVRPEQKHVYGMWMYNCQGRHGELHLWLFPNRPEGEVAFAAYLYEEDLK